MHGSNSATPSNSFLNYQLLTVNHLVPAIGLVLCGVPNDAGVILCDRLAAREVVLQTGHSDFFAIFLHFSKNYCIFAPVISPRLGIMSFGWGGCRHNKALKALCVWLIGISQILTVPTHCSILMSSGCVYSIRSYFIYVRACVYISAWASVLLVRNRRRCESLN